MSETPPEAPPVEAPAGMSPEDFEFWDDSTLTYYERLPDGVISARPYNENEVAQLQTQASLDGLHEEAIGAIGYLDQRIDLSLAYLALPAPTGEETAAQIKVLSDLAAYSAGTLKRVIKVLSVLVNKPM